MFSRFARWLLLLYALLTLGGCARFEVREQIDQEVCEHAFRTIDAEPIQLPPTKPLDQSSATVGPKQESTTPSQPPNAAKEGVKSRRLVPPPGLPGSDAPPIQLPPANAPEAEQEAARLKLFPPLPPFGKEPQPLQGPNGNPLSLADLQRLARANNPDVVRAAANVRAMEGAAVQAGLHPNPNFGYSADTINTAHTAGYQGVFFEQLIKTGGKLELARQVANVDVMNARVALRAAENDVATRVRAAYFAVLGAQENVRVNRALVEFTEEVYQAALDLLRHGFAVSYEPMLLRAQVFQARNNLVQARNSYQSYWRQLAAALGLPGMPPTQLAGRIDLAFPVFHFEQVRDEILRRHTDVLTAQNDILRARLNLRLAQITPIPDIDLQLKFQRDYPGFTNATTTSIQLTVPVPVFDRNQGNIMQAEAQLRAAEEEPHRARDDLLSRLADAFGRYETNRVQIQYYRTVILPDQLRGYLGLFNRYQVDSVSGAKVQVGSPPPTFQDLVTAQQNLATTIQAYLTVLGAAWTAVTDVANLMQTEDLFQLGEKQEVQPIPELGPLPCCHPCSPLRDPNLSGGDGPWVPAAPEEQRP